MASAVAPDIFWAATSLSRSEEAALAHEIRAKFRALETPDFDIYSELTVREMETLVAVSKRERTSVAVVVARILTGAGFDLN